MPTMVDRHRGYLSYCTLPLYLKKELPAVDHNLGSTALEPKGGGVLGVPFVVRVLTGASCRRAVIIVEHQSIAIVCVTLECSIRKPGGRAVSLFIVVSTSGVVTYYVVTCLSCRH